MSTFADKASENKRQGTGSSMDMETSQGDLSLGSSVAKSDAVVQRKLHQAINDSPQVRQLKAYQAMAATPSAPPVQEGKSSPAQKVGNQTGLPDELKSSIESLSGFSLDDVKVHYNSSKPAQVNAFAYTQGTDIFLGQGQEKHLPHEAWHVVQVKQGKVKPTAELKGNVSLNNDKGLEDEADRMGEIASRSNAVVDHPSGLAAGASGNATIQCKGPAPLMTQINPLLGWAMDKIGHAKNYDPDFKPLFEKINNYDRSKDGRPQAQYDALVAMKLHLSQWALAQGASFKGADEKNYRQLNDILMQELAVVQGQRDRLEKYTRDADSPYDQMTDEGMLWSDLTFEHNQSNLGKTGKSYFEALSSMNLDSIGKEEQGSGADKLEWYKVFINNATEALSNAVVNHYTTSIRAQSMVDGGGMKSKMMLEKDLASFKHNTSIYDDLGLGNSGFLFFFIEPQDAPLRGSRFAEGDQGADPARISIPIQESGLLTDGWIMLSDFAQREYPDVMTKTGTNDHSSTLPTRKDEHLKKKPDHSETVRSFTPGMGDFDDAMIEDMMAIKDSDQRQAFAVVRPQASGDAKSKQTYAGPEGKFDVPDRLFNNVLVGKDIIPGLAHRAALEVARIGKVNPALGDKLSKLSGSALLLYILKDSFRPQAMIPNGLKISREHVQS